MRKFVFKNLKRLLVVLLVINLLVLNPYNNVFFVQKTYAAEVQVKNTNVNVRSGPGTSYKVLGQVSLGFKITILDTVKDATNNGKTWYKFMYNGNANAYIRSDFCKASSTYTYDGPFEARLQQQGFPESYKPALRQLHADFPNWIFTVDRINMDFDYAVRNELDGARTLVNASSISSYKSTDAGKYDYTTSKWTNFDGASWVAASEAITRYYMDPRNFLYDPYIFQFEEQTFDPYIHSLDALKEMVKGTFLEGFIETEGLSGTNTIIPNFSNTTSTYNNNYNTNYNNTYNNTYNNVYSAPIVDKGPGTVPGGNASNVIKAPVKGNGPGMFDAPQGITGAAMPLMENKNTITAFSNIIISGGTNPNLSTNIAGSETEAFRYTYLPKGVYTYSDVIYNACSQVGANPYVIAAMILQEQGVNGSDSISGTNAKFPSTYNYGNVNSYASNGLSAIENGLKYASSAGSYNRPWNTKEKGIYGVCDFYANSYIKLGQDTFYYKKWNVKGENLFKHQYMTNVSGAALEGQVYASAYSTFMKNTIHEFRIPVYNNMPEEISPLPTKDGSPNNRLKVLTVNGFTLDPKFNTDILNYSTSLKADTKNINIIAEPYDNRARVTGTGQMTITNEITLAVVNVTAENGDTRMYAIGIYKPGGVKTDLTNAQSVAGSITQVEAPTNTQNTPPVNTQNNTSVIPNIVNNNNVQIIGGNSNTNTNHSSNIIYSTNNYSNSTSTPIIGKGPGE